MRGGIEIRARVCCEGKGGGGRPSPTATPVTPVTNINYDTVGGYVPQGSGLDCPPGVTSPLGTPFVRHGCHNLRCDPRR